MRSQMARLRPQLKRTSASLAAVEDPSPKRTKPSVDDYTFSEQIGGGAHGAVYLARHLPTGKTVAVKVQELNDDALSEVEFHTAAAAHPSVVTLKEVIVGHGAVYMVMPYFRYTLRSLLDGSPRGFQEDRVRMYISQLLQGVAHVHRRQIIHRDIKPDNILVTSRGVVEIADFGVACRIGEAYYPAGTVQYSAPETFLRQEYTAAADIWSVGCVMYELLFKENLFQEEEDEIDLLNKVFRVLGVPDKRDWPEFYNAPLVKEGVLDLEGIKEDADLGDVIPRSQISHSCFHLLSRMLTTNPNHRITAMKALAHPWFEDRPLA